MGLKVQHSLNLCVPSMRTSSRPSRYEYRTASMDHREGRNGSISVWVLLVSVSLNAGPAPKFSSCACTAVGAHLGGCQLHQVSHNHNLNSL